MREKTHAHYHFDDDVSNIDKSKRINELNTLFKNNKSKYLKEYKNEYIIVVCLDIGKNEELICMSLNGINVVVKQDDYIDKQFN